MDEDIMSKATRFTVVVVALITACGVGDTLLEVDKAVDTFHSELDAGSYNEIYQAAHEEFHKSGTEADSAKFLGTIHEKLGKVKQTHRVNWRVFYGPAGKAMTVVYDTEFTDGKGTETFTFFCLDNGVI